MITIEDNVTGEIHHHAGTVLPYLIGIDTEWHSAFLTVTPSTMSWRILYTLKGKHTPSVVTIPERFRIVISQKGETNDKQY